MIDEITPASIASEVHLLREDCKYEGAFVFVEGETDFALFSSFFNDARCKVKRVNGKDNVLQVVDLLLNSGEELCVAIVDADFWHIEDKQPPHVNIYVTDTHDIETQIFMSPALEKICRELFPSVETQGIIDNLPNIRKQIMSVASTMAIIRLANHKFNLRICFYIDKENSTTIDWESAINIQRFTVDFERLLKIVCRDDYSQIHRIRGPIRECCKNKYKLSELCNGHDVIFVTLLFLKHNGRKQECKALSTKNLEKMLRLAYEGNYFRETELYRNLLSWQKTSGMEILKI